MTMPELSEFDVVPVCDLPKCTRQATHILTCHQIDHCQDKGAPPSGCKSFLFCPECVTGIGGSIAERVRAMKDAVRDQGLTLECNQCGMSIDHLSDVLNVEHLLPVQAV